MTDTVDEPWAGDADVLHKTDTDLEQSRTYNTKVSDNTFELHRMAETLRQREGMETWSGALDRGLRVELAYLIDSRQVTFTREDYDIAYTIPPAGWLEQQVFGEVDLVPEDEIDTDDRLMTVSTPPVCYEMAKEAVEEAKTTSEKSSVSQTRSDESVEGAYDSVTALVRGGALRLLGRK